MTVLFKLTPAGDLRQLRSGRQNREVFNAPFWYADAVARQLIADGCSESQVHDGLPTVIQSRLTDGDVRSEPALTYRATTGRFGARMAVRL